MSHTPSPQNIRGHFGWTIERLAEILKNEKTDYYRDASLERFGFTYDLSLKCLRAFMETAGSPCESDRECFEWAENQQLLNPDIDWKEVIDSYESIKKNTDTKLADSVYQKLDDYYRFFQDLHDKCANR